MGYRDSTSLAVSGGLGTNGSDFVSFAFARRPNRSQTHQNWLGCRHLSDFDSGRHFFPATQLVGAWTFGHGFRSRNTRRTRSWLCDAISHGSVELAGNVLGF